MTFYDNFLLCSKLYNEHYLENTGPFYKKYSNFKEKCNQQESLNESEFASLTTLQKERLKSYFEVKYLYDDEQHNYYKSLLNESNELEIKVKLQRKLLDIPIEKDFFGKYIENIKKYLLNQKESQLKTNNIENFYKSFQYYSLDPKYEDTLNYNVKYIVIYNNITDDYQYIFSSPFNKHKYFFDKFETVFLSEN